MTFATTKHSIQKAIGSFAESHSDPYLHGIGLCLQVVGFAGLRHQFVALYPADFLNHLTNLLWRLRKIKN